MNRRDMLKLSSLAAAAATAPAMTEASTGPEARAKVERWDCVELPFTGPADGNPFLDVKLTATFRLKNRALTVEGFYDGDGAYKVRFMPDDEGTWTWTTASGAPQLDGKSGAFECVAPGEGNRGPVSVRDDYHFGYANGTPFVECGTTCYAWGFQAEQTQRQTIETLSNSPFNKLQIGRAHV